MTTPLDDSPTHLHAANEALARRRRNRRAIDAYREGTMEPIMFVSKSSADAPSYRSPLDALADSWWQGFGYGMAVSVLVIAVVTGVTLWAVGVFS